MSCGDDRSRTNKSTSTERDCREATRREIGEIYIMSNIMVRYLTSPTCQGNSPRPASSPPTILVLLLLILVFVLLRPHAQEELVGVACVVVVRSGGLVTRDGGRQHP